jgi:hypothetical protein
VNPPDPVKPAFNEVNQAIQEKERLINDAWADYNQTMHHACVPLTSPNHTDVPPHFLPRFPTRRGW